MKIFFSLRHSGAIRNFGSVLRGLAAQGHHIHISFIMADKIDHRGGRIITELQKECPTITCSELLKRTNVRWFELARAIRFTIDLLRYRLPIYADSIALRARAERRVPRPARWLTKIPIFGWKLFNQAAHRLLLAIERAIPVDPVIEADVLEQQPDLLLVSPLVDLGSDQVDYIKVAKKHGIRSGLCVHSWDNLTNKGLIRIHPDRAYVWNEVQLAEAVDHHGMDASQVVVTGASNYDQWFDWEPSRGPEAFKSEVGLDPDTPYLLYLCSSPFIAATEINFIEEWIAAIRASGDPVLRNIGLLVRPHPENRQPWHRLDPSTLGNTAIWPLQGANPVDLGARSDYYDSIFHSCGIVGINTSGQIEAGVVGRKVFTVRRPEFADSQAGTLHFHYLTDVGGGLVQVGDDLAEHLTQLQKHVGSEEDGEAARRFVREFVRPHGLEVNATELFVKELVAQGETARPNPQRIPFWLLPARWLFAPLAILMHWKIRIVRRRRKAERVASSGSLTSQIIAAPRKLALQTLYGILRRRRVRGFVNRYVIPRVAGDQVTFPKMVVTERQIQRLARSPKDKIIVGPWLSEVGFEVLYWIPFLNWVRTHRDFDPERLVVVSRGGVSHWYKPFTDNYFDILDFMSPEDYLRANEKRMAQGKQKQRGMSDFDRDILRITKQVLKDKDAEILHPATMYNLFMPYWKRRATIDLVERFTVFCKHQEIDCSDIEDRLPDSYIATRFYFNDAFPDTEQNRVFIAQLLGRLTQRHDVVLLNPGFATDDHWDFAPEDLEHLHTVDDLMTPSTNLEIQTKVISRAKAYIGTYGGLSYLPPFYGVSSLALYSRPQGFLYHHLELADRVFLCMDDATFTAIDVRDIDLFNIITGEGFFPTMPREGRGKRVVLGGPGSLDTEKTEQAQAEMKVPNFLSPSVADKENDEASDDLVLAPPSGREHERVEPKRILFVMQYPGYLRYFDSVLDHLAKRGHHVMVAFDNPRKQNEGLVCLDGLNEGIEVVGPVPQRKDRYKELARGLRTMVDYVRYLHPDYSDAPYLRGRMGDVLPAPMKFMRRMPSLGPRSTKFLIRSLERFEYGIPTDTEVEKFVSKLQPDAVVVTPLVTDGSTQVDVVKAARQLGIRTALCVASWDHLTTKGLIRLHPDRIFVWNNLQKREAVKYHHVSSYSVRMTGAHPFDKWFEWEPSMTRQEFCGKVDLTAQKPYILFVGSTASISGPEAEIEFVLEWIRCIRDADDPALRDVAILIRPHPYNPGNWADVDLSGLGDVSVWPKNGANPVDDRDRREYFDSLYYAAVVVGVNTTAMIEAAIVDRPVRTIRTDDFRETQGGTLHFHYLLEKRDGFVKSADGFDEHLAQLAEALANPRTSHSRNAAFTRSFIRPHGPSTPCTPIMSRQIEVLAHKHLKPRRAVPRRYLPINAAFSVIGGMVSASRRRMQREAITKFDQMYSELVAYKRDHGDCLVPRKWPENRHLGRWVYRRQKRLVKLTEDQTQRLNEIGFVWDPDAE
ncbi:MAG TPA: helicase associated domain-containing protein [Acidobacteriota bacterium]|jgi:hypothetical protein|nr:helicase associated domain-containing protein [Acidobacteriota bacterium]|tara:strand:+ start:333 stop:4841 length:4509 start_codon:yes stop_codon:yes gene_type:complete